MSQDCDFLDELEALRSWLGFRMSGNPFFIPHQGNIGQDPDTSSLEKSSKDTADDLEFDKIGVTDVGRQPWLGPLEIEVVQNSEEILEGKRNRSKRWKRRKTGRVNSLAPYAAAVVNDLTLLPTRKAQSATRLGAPDPAGVTGGSRTDVLGFLPKTASVDIEGLVPNLVSREDAQRISVAKQVLMEEERRVLEAATAAEAADGGNRSGRRRSRASSAFSDVGGRNRQTSTASSILSDATPNTSRGDSQGRSWSILRLPSKRLNSKSRRQFLPRPGSTAGTVGLDSRVAPTSPETGEMRSIVLTTAGLQQQPPPDPHPGLGPVLLRSERPGGELHPSPFLHTISDALAAKTEDLELKISISTPNMPDWKTMNRCSTAPAVTSRETSGSVRRFQSRGDRHPSVNEHRVSTAPANLSSTPAPPDTSRSEEALPNSRGSDQEGFVPRVGGTSPLEESERPGSSYSRRGLGLSQKAGAELRALTAAGTTGRRQPPPRELRLRRLARDVARHSAELRRLVREEDRLRKKLARRCGSDGRPRESDSITKLLERGIDAEGVEEDNAVGIMVAIRQDDGENLRGSFAPATLASSGSPEQVVKNKLEAKQREIELKAFDLGIKRDELGCLRIVQKQERERKLALEMEKRRVHLDEGQVRLRVESTCHATRF